MKKAINFLTAFLMFGFCMLFAVNLQAQDSTTLQLITDGSAYAADKWTVAAKIVFWVAIISEMLAVIPSKYLPVNGITDAVIKILKAVGKAKK